MAKFCSQCGRPLQEGEICHCTDQQVVTEQENVQSDMNQTVETENSQQKTSEEGTQGTEKQNTYQQPAQKTVPNPVVEELKEGLLRILPSFKIPATEVKNLASKNSPIIGLEFMVIKAVLTLIGMLIMFRDMLEYLPVGTLILLILLITIGADCLEAFLLNVLSGSFKVKTSRNGMFGVVGIRTLYESALLIIVAILSLISGGFAMAVSLVGSATFTILQYGIYAEVAEGEANKKIFAHMITRAIVVLAIVLVTYLIGKSIITDVMGSMLGGLGSFYY